MNSHIPRIERTTESVLMLALAAAPTPEAKVYTKKRFDEASKHGQLAAFDYIMSITRIGVMFGTWPGGQT